MTHYSNFNLIYRLQKWMDSVAGQTFMNYAYSWGAAVVILGTLFKLTHLPFANVMLFLGMGTEVFVFFISAFDRPFDKTADGQVLFNNNMTTGEDMAHEQTPTVPTLEISDIADKVVDKLQSLHIAAATEAAERIAQKNEEKDDGEEKHVDIAEALNAMQNPSWLQLQTQISPEMAEAQQNYVESLNNLTDMLAKVSEQSEKLTQNSAEMENLNRTLTGICKIYEMHLKSAGSQVGVIDLINDQTRKMATQIEQLNSIYTRMIEAMTINMRAAAPGVNLNN
ncbi:MAG: gliding motility protein GldL [Bacteroidaceae bacterium]|nr:gliding motility protein GldL [Bacteroidaceae bacterium]